MGNIRSMKKGNLTPEMTHAAALGLTCKDAFTVFSQHETLRLQKVVSDLEVRLAKYEPIQLPSRMYKCHEDYSMERDDANDYLLDWIDHNVTECTFRNFEEMGIHAVCNMYDLHETISYCVFWLVGNKAYSDGLANRALDVVDAALQSSHHTEQHYWEAFLGTTWCQDKLHVQHIVGRSVITFIENCLISDGAVDWKGD